MEIAARERVNGTAKDFGTQETRKPAKGELKIRTKPLKDRTAPAMKALWPSEKTMNIGRKVITVDFNKEPTRCHPKRIRKWGLINSYRIEDQ